MAIATVWAIFRLCITLGEKDVDCGSHSNNVKIYQLRELLKEGFRNGFTCAAVFEVMCGSCREDAKHSEAGAI